MNKNNTKIWRELYTYESEVFGFIKSAVGNGDIACDLYQDVFLTVLKNIEKLDTNRSIKNWLYTVTRNRVINYLQSKKRREFELFNDSLLQSKISETKDGDLIDSVLAQLPERQKKILILREKEGWGYQELAGKLNLTVPAVTSLLKRAREAFQKNYLLRFLPDWFAKSAESIDLSDVFRFINPFNPPVNLLETIDRKCHQYFARVQQTWDDTREKYISLEQIKAVLQKVINRENLHILDCGAGTGSNIINLADAGHRICAVDIQPGMIHRLRMLKSDKPGRAFFPVQADIRRLPIRSNSVDIILLIFILHHLAAPLDFISHCSKLLKDKGKIIIIDFQRHTKTKIADQMGDLWMGFDPGMLMKTGSKKKLFPVLSGTITDKEQLNSFYLIFEKQK